MDTPWSTAEQMLTVKTGIVKRNSTRKEVTNTETLTKTYEQTGNSDNNGDQTPDRHGTRLGRQTSNHKKRLD